MAALPRPIRKGADEAMWFVYCEPDGETPRSLAGVEVTFTARRAAYSAEAVMEKEVGTGIVVTDEGEGEGEVWFDEDDFADLSTSTTLVASLRFVESGETWYEDFPLPVKVGA